MTAVVHYFAPRTLEELARIVGGTGGVVLAGGTDLHPRISKELVARPAALVDIKAVEALRGIRWENGEISIGACTRMAELERDPVIVERAGLLAEAAGRIACPQIRNRATVGGNLCNASPAADTAVPLIVLDAVLELASVNQGRLAVRELPITGFFRGPGSTSLEPGGILTRIRFKPLPDGWFSAWDKMGTRPAMEIAVAAVGVVLGMEDGVVSHARVGYGSVAPVPLRGHQAEAELVGRGLTESVIESCTAAAGREVAPISDVRASQPYRRQIVRVMLRRMLERAKCA